MNCTRFRAAFGAAAITATLLASGSGLSPASAAPTGHHGSAAGHATHKGGHQDKGGHGKSGNHADKDAKKLAKAVAKQDAAFVKLGARAARKLSENSYAPVAANITADRALLAGLTAVQDVRDLQPENYDQVIAWLRKADKLAGTVEAPDAATTDAVAAAVEKLLTITATSTKADLRAAKRLLGDLEDVVASDETGDETGEETGDDGGTDTGV